MTPEQLTDLDNDIAEMRELVQRGWRLYQWTGDPRALWRWWSCSWDLLLYRLIRWALSDGTRTPPAPKPKNGLSPITKPEAGAVAANIPAEHADRTPTESAAEAMSSHAYGGARVPSR
jgi:hypothetical protein